MRKIWAFIAACALVATGLVAGASAAQAVEPSLTNPKGTLAVTWDTNVQTLVLFCDTSVAAENCSPFAGAMPLYGAILTGKTSPTVFMVGDEVVVVPGGEGKTAPLPAGKYNVNMLTNDNPSIASLSNVVIGAVEPKPNAPVTPPPFPKASSIAHPGKSVLLKKSVLMLSGDYATAKVRFVEYVQGVRPRGDTPVSSKLGTYKVTKSGKVIVNVLSSQPMTVILTLRAPKTDEYLAYKSVKTWTLK